MPALYLSHGAPPLVDDATWVSELAAWSAELPEARRDFGGVGALGVGTADHRVDDHGNLSHV